MLKSIFETEILKEMEHSLVKQANNQNVDNLDQAVDYLNSAIDIFEESGFTAQADEILNILNKIAKQGKPKRPKDPRIVSDRHTKGLTSEKAIKNLKEHGTMFNLSDTAYVDDLLTVTESDDDMIEDGSELFDDE